MHTITLDIAGHQITVRSGADEHYVRDLGSLLDERVRQAAKQGAGPVAAVLLTALGLADELEKTRALLEQQVERTTQHVSRLQIAIDTATGSK